jgi:hypothetical protein
MNVYGLICSTCIFILFFICKYSTAVNVGMSVLSSWLAELSSSAVSYGFVFFASEVAMSVAIIFDVPRSILFGSSNLLGQIVQTSGP